MTNTTLNKTEISPLLKGQIQDGTVTLADVLKTVEEPTTSAIVERPKVASVKPITDAQKKALKTLPSVYGKVVTDRPRVLKSEEIEDLYVERKNIDEIDRALKVGKERIRTTILNHNDLVCEAIGIEDPEFDKDGHYLFPNVIPVANADESFTWEVRESAPTLSADRLAELDAAGEIDHDVYLSLTEQVRVVNEQRVLLALQKDPELVLDIIKKASLPGTKTGAFNLRKNK